MLPVWALQLLKMKRVLVSVDFAVFGFFILAFVALGHYIFSFITLCTMIGVLMLQAVNLEACENHFNVAPPFGRLLKKKQKKTT